MCGIVFVKSKDAETAKQVAMLQYQHQKRRGTQGFGILEIGAEVPILHKMTTETEFLEALEKTNSDTLLLHHRMPTSTPNIKKAAHPFYVTAGKHKMYVTHNGVVSNDDDVLEKFSIKPKRLSSYDKLTNKFNDSEALALDFINAVATGRKELLSIGSIAIVAYSVNQHALFLYRNNRNPLIHYRVGETLMLASEAPVPYGSLIVADRLIKYDLKTGVLKECREMKSREYETVSQNHSKHSTPSANFSKASNDREIARFERNHRSANDEYYENMAAYHESRDRKKQTVIPLLPNGKENKTKLDTVLDEISKQLSDVGKMQSEIDNAGAGRRSYAYKTVGDGLRFTKDANGNERVPGKQVPCIYNGTKVCDHKHCVVDYLLRLKMPNEDNCPGCFYSDTEYRTRVKHCNDMRCETWLERETTPDNTKKLGKGETNFIDKLSDINGSNDAVKVVPVDETSTEFVTDLDYNFDEIEEAASLILNTVVPDPADEVTEKVYNKLIEYEATLSDLIDDMPDEFGLKYLAEKQLSNQILDRIAVLRHIIELNEAKFEGPTKSVIEATASAKKPQTVSEYERELERQEDEGGRH